MSKSALYEQECQRSDLRRMDQRAEVALFDCWETEKEIVLAGDFPGMKPQDIEIEFHEQVLSIRSARAGGSADGKMLRREFEPGTRERSYRMNEDINTDGIKASFENGVLTVVLPIVQPVAPRQIPVSTC